MCCGDPGPPRIIRGEKIVPKLGMTPLWLYLLPYVALSSASSPQSRPLLPNSVPRSPQPMPSPCFCSKKPTVLPKGPASPLCRSWLWTSAPAALRTLFLNHTPPSPSSSASLFLCSVFSRPRPCPIPAHMLTRSACGPY